MHKSLFLCNAIRDSGDEAGPLAAAVVAQEGPEGVAVAVLSDEALHQCLESVMSNNDKFFPLQSK